MVSADTLQAKREEVVKVTAALLKLARNFAQAPQSWAAAVAKARPEVPPAELRELAQAYASDWCIDGCFERSELEAAARVLYASPAFAGLQPPRFESWADMSILAEAQNRTARLPAGHEAER